MLSPYHLQVASQFVDDLRASIAKVPEGDEESAGSVSTYGGIA
jgi:hypothetical protein